MFSSNTSFNISFLGHKSGTGHLVFIFLKSDLLLNNDLFGINLLLTHNLSAKSSNTSQSLFLSSAQYFFIYHFNNSFTFQTSTHNCLANLVETVIIFLGVNCFKSFIIAQGFILHHFQYFHQVFSIQYALFNNVSTFASGYCFFNCIINLSNSAHFLLLI